MFLVIHNVVHFIVQQQFADVILRRRFMVRPRQPRSQARVSAPAAAGARAGQATQATVPISESESITVQLELSLSTYRKRIRTP